MASFRMQENTTATEACAGRLKRVITGWTRLAIMLITPIQSSTEATIVIPIKMGMARRKKWMIVLRASAQIAFGLGSSRNVGLSMLKIRNGELGILPATIRE